MQEQIKPVKTVKTLLRDLISTQAPENVNLLSAIIERERLYVSDASKVVIDQIEQLVLTAVANESNGQDAAN